MQCHQKTQGLNYRSAGAAPFTHRLGKAEPHYSAFQRTINMWQNHDKTCWHILLIQGEDSLVPSNATDAIKARKVRKQVCNERKESTQASRQWMQGNYMTKNATNAADTTGKMHRQKPCHSCSASVTSVAFPSVKTRLNKRKRTVWVLAWRDPWAWCQPTFPRTWSSGARTRERRTYRTRRETHWLADDGWLARRLSAYRGPAYNRYITKQKRYH